MSKIKLWGKKLLAVSLTLAMISVMATGCSKKNDDGASTTTPTSAPSSTDTGSDTEAAATTAPAEMVTINVYRPSFNIAAADQAEVQKVQDAVNAYIGPKIGVNIAITDISSGEYTDKTNLALTSGEVDLFFTANWEQTIGCDDLVKNNAVYDFTSLLPNYDLYTSIPNWVWGSSSYAGKNFFVPIYKESAEGYSLMFRTDMIDKFGWDITTVKSLKDIEPMLEQLKGEGLKYPYLTQKTQMFHRYYLDSFDFFTQNDFIGVSHADDTVVDTVLSPEFKDFCTLMGDWAQKGYLSEDDLTKTTTDTTIQTADWGISWWTNVPNNEEADGRYSRDVQMAKVCDSWVQSGTTLGSCYAISANSSEDKAIAALKFLSLLYTDQTLANMYTFGIEGTDYTVDADGRVAKSDAGLYNHSMWESAPVTILGLEAGEPADKVTLYSTFNDSAKVSNAAGFRFDKTNIDAQYAACVQVENEFGFALENGGYAPADIDQAIADYQKALDDAGYQDVLAEAQAQFDAWKALRK